MSDIHEGVLVGIGIDANGKAEFQSLPWRGLGFELRPSARPFRRAALFATTPGDRLELALPAGEWRLVLYRHDWSGFALVRDARAYALHDLFSVDPGEVEIPVVSGGPQSPVVIEAAPQRHSRSLGSQVWLIEVRSGRLAFAPEAGRAVSSTCRLIEGKHGHFLALRTDTGVANQLASTGLWEQEQIELFHRLARPGEAVLDIGANIGHHTVALSKLVGEDGAVVAFEPQMQMFNLLNANLVLNRCRNVSPHRLAIGSKRDRMRMGGISYDEFMPFGALGLQRSGPPGRGESVDVVTLDEFLPTLEIDAPLTLMKVDVQAHELYVFQGAREFLRREQPSISFEVGPYWMQRAGYDWREILTLLSNLGYSFFDEAGAPLALPKWDGESRREWQFVAVAPRYRARLG